MTIRRMIKTEADMLALGKRVAQKMERHGFIALCGDLGAGKTVFARGVAEAFGIGHVSSPTFMIVCEYPTEPKLYHFDVYRLSDADELYAISIEGSGADCRTVVIEPHGARTEELFSEDSCI